ncbi:MAG: hypothetical protein M3461_08365 [Pseudomonadota bacterium]|nr:hypothetical protein [Pseudomonadota bacterium]
MTIIAAIEDPPVIAKILTHLGLSARAPPRRLAFDRLQMAFYEGPVVKPRRQIIFNLLWLFSYPHVPRRCPPELFTLCPRTKTFSQS